MTPATRFKYLALGLVFLHATADAQSAAQVAAHSPATGAPNAANSMTGMESARDRYRYVLDQPVVAPPGQTYN